MLSNIILLQEDLFDGPEESQPLVGEKNEKQVGCIENSMIFLLRSQYCVLLTQVKGNILLVMMW